MARIRSIKPEFWVSEQVGDCSPMARLTFVGMWNFCDDRGVHPAKPKTLKAELFPMDDFSAEALSGWVAELVKVGLVAEFESNGDLYWHVTGWTKHQKIDKPSFKYPNPPAPISNSARRLLAEPSPNASGAPPPGVESNGMESNGMESKTPDQTQAELLPPEETPSVSKDTGSGEPPSDAERVFAVGVSLLMGAGQAEKNARSLLGMFVRDSGASHVLARLQECAEALPADPVSWLTSRLARKASSGKPASSFAGKDYNKGTTNV